MLQSETRTLLAIAEAATPAGRAIQAPTDSLIGEIETVVRSQFGPSALPLYRTLVRALDLAAIPLTGRRACDLPLGERQALFERLNESSSATFWLLRAVVAPVKAARLRDDAVLAALQSPMATCAPASNAPPERWEQRVLDARELDADETLEVDCVIVGTGAGGAPLAHSLAGRGHAVLMLEAGGHFTRRDFNGDSMLMRERMYRGFAASMALSNTPLLVPMGMTVGGSTTVNSGTCYRVPAAVQRRWMLEEGLNELGPGSLDAHYESVEKMLGVGRATAQTLGGCADVIARGAEALGLHHEPLMRNAPGCDGQGLCCFGCPTDAKRGANVSYVPAAVQRGAMVFCHAPVQEVLVERDRAVGVVATATRADGRVVRLTVKASSVVLAAGSFGTPELLLRNRLANSSGQVGKRLTLHPACYSWARFDEDIRGWEGIPQGYGIEEYAGLGLRFEGAFLPIDAAAATFGQVGRRWTDLVEGFDKLACFGFMVSDRSRGRVFLAPGGKARMAYWLNDADKEMMIRGQAILARVYLAAGARAVYPGMRVFDELNNEADVRRLERDGPSMVKAHHIDVSAYHPLGSCRMGADPRRYVVGANNETHDVRHLFVCDGSTVPGPLGVNPQMTIMALSERAAQHVERRIEEGAARTAASNGKANGHAASNGNGKGSGEGNGEGNGIAKASGRGIEMVAFTETMGGELLICRGANAGRRVRAEFHVTATLEGPLFVGTRALFMLDGTVHIPGVVDGRRCEGSLALRPLARKGTLVYELDFEDDGGAPLHLRGTKDVGLLSPLRGMTTLATAVRDAAGLVVAEGILRFDLRDARRWLGTWRWRRRSNDVVATA